MAKNEAKIQFTADTKAFNDSIKKADSQMKLLRSELKLNDTQMKATGETVEGLKKKHDLLTDQLQASQAKTEALANKVEAAVRIYGEGSTEVEKWRTKLANAQTAEEKLRQEVAQCSDALKEQEAAANKTETATEKLTSTISRQQSELDSLKEAYVETVLKLGDGSDEAKDLANQIEKLSGELKDSKSEFDRVESAADKLDKTMQDAGDSARESSDGFTVAKGAIADLASSAIQAAIGKLSEFIGYLAELPEATRELRQDMATLETSFETAGLTTEQATNTWKDLYTVFGEDDRAVEAANLIAKMSDNQKDLNDWVTITTGIWGSYQDSLPVEGLAEASMETAKTGEVTGVLADALNWSSDAASMFAKYMGEDVVTAEDAFNVALSECTTEQERQALITDTLTALYGDAATKYEEASGQQLAAKEATAENTLAQAEMANAIEPVTTAWEGLKTELMVAALPAIEKVSAIMQDVLGWMQEHPKAVMAITAVLGVLGISLGLITIAWGAYSIAQWAANSALLAFPGTWIVAAIVAVIAIIAVIIVYWDEIAAACSKAWESIKATLSVWGEWINANVIQPIVSFFKGLWDSIKETWENVKQGTVNAWNSIKDSISKAWNGIKTSVSNGINNAKTAISNGWNTVKSTTSNVWNGIKSTISNAWNNIKSGASSAVNGVKSTVSNAFNSIKSTATIVWNGIKDAITRPIEAAKDKVRGIVDSISGFFSNMKLELPKIKLPHFSISGKFSLSPLSVPKLSVSWYKDGGIMMKPTVFGVNGTSLMAGGEAGPEAILPIDRLEGYIHNAIEKSQQVVNLQALADAIEDLANRPIEMSINGRQFAKATAGDGDSVNGLRNTFKTRGLILD